ncbi:DUF6265 family protein [Sphingomonas sp.]|uniref:DUF6265 family protein n=1 Tax=Sphingomonas sp. TaxID=28214 RepID=UPI002DD698B7|nr:DUF6265 family protein [Sphingomonas sp.]
MIGAAPDPGAPLPSWMAGCWIEDRAPRWTEECWTIPRAGSMLGSNRAGNGDRLTMWEAMQILPDPDGRPVFWASPRGAPRSAFPMASAKEGEIAFANPAHDYPQRIRYWREGELLKAEVSLADGSKPMRWSFRRMK